MECKGKVWCQVFVSIYVKIYKLNNHRMMQIYKVIYENILGFKTPWRLYIYLNIVLQTHVIAIIKHKCGRQTEDLMWRVPLKLLTTSTQVFKRKGESLNQVAFLCILREIKFWIKIKITIIYQVGRIVKVDFFWIYEFLLPSTTRFHNWQ